MAIARPGCGRHYDVTLFEYERTVGCACGARVAFQHRIEVASRIPPPGGNSPFERGNARPARPPQNVRPTNR